MDLEKINNIIKGIEVVEKEEKVRKDTYTLIRLRETITYYKDRIEKGDITTLVNDYYLKDINQYYETNFVCEKDEDYIEVINATIICINRKFGKYLHDELIKEIIKKIDDKYNE